MDTEEAQRILAKYDAELSHLRGAMDIAFGSNVSSNPLMPEDIVVFSLGVVTKELFEELLLLVSHGRGEAALRVSRTLYECVVFAAYVSKHPDSCGAFMNTLFASWANILRSIPERAKLLPEMHSDFSERFPKYAQGKQVPLDWNDDRTTFNMAADVGVSGEFHSLAFNFTSAYVHPSASFLLGRMTYSADNRFVFGAKRDDSSWQIALRIAHDLIITSMRLRKRYSDSVELRLNLEFCEKEFVQIWGYAPESSR